METNKRFKFLIIYVSTLQYHSEYTTVFSVKYYVSINYFSDEDSSFFTTLVKGTKKYL